MLPLLHGATGVRNGMYRTGMGRDGGRINKTLRFCRRCIDVVFILSSLMSTCELDRFVIQTPYIKVVKSCSAPFVDRLQRQAGTDGWTDVDERTNGQTDERRNSFPSSSMSFRPPVPPRLPVTPKRRFI